MAREQYQIVSGPSLLKLIMAFLDPNDYVHIEAHGHDGKTLGPYQGHSRYKVFIDGLIREDPSLVNIHISGWFRVRKSKKFPEGKKCFSGHYNTQNRFGNIEVD